MAKSMRKMLLLAKLELVSGTEEAGLTTTHAMLCRALAPSPINAEYVGRDNIKPYMGNNPQLATGIHRELTCEVELAGSGTVGTPPAWDPLLRACGFSVSNPTGSPGEVHYQPMSDNLPTVTLWGYLDGLRFRMAGCRGTVVFNMSAKAIPVMQFRFVGEYQIYTDTPLLTGVNYNNFIAPVTVGRVFSRSFTLHGVAACMSSLTIDVATNLAYRDLVGCGGPSISNRAPTGQVVFELGTAAEKNWGEVIKNSTEGTLIFAHGINPGNMITFECPRVTCNNISFSEDEGIAMVNLGLAINPYSGNDEVVITLQ